MRLCQESPKDTPRGVLWAIRAAKLLGKALRDRIDRHHTMIIALNNPRDPELTVAQALVARGVAQHPLGINFDGRIRRAISEVAKIVDTHLIVYVFQVIMLDRFGAGAVDLIGTQNRRSVWDHPIRGPISIMAIPPIVTLAPAIAGGVQIVQIQVRLIEPPGHFRVSPGELNIDIRAKAGLDRDDRGLCATKRILLIIDFEFE